jgi:hypothetical protein
VRGFKTDISRTVGVTKVGTATATVVTDGIKLTTAQSANADKVSWTTSFRPVPASTVTEINYETVKLDAPAPNNAVNDAALAAYHIYVRTPNGDGVLGLRAVLLLDVDRRGEPAAIEVRKLADHRRQIVDAAHQSAETVLCVQLQHRAGSDLPDRLAATEGVGELVRSGRYLTTSVIGSPPSTAGWPIWRVSSRLSSASRHERVHGHAGDQIEQTGDEDVVEEDHPAGQEADRRSDAAPGHSCRPSRPSGTREPSGRTTGR